MKMSQRAAQGILEDIVEGSYPPGSELPAEAALAERYGVSRPTVREAVMALAGNGVVQVRHGKRSLVQPPEQWSVLDPASLGARGRLSADSPRLMDELMEARQVLEVSLVRLAAQRITGEQLTALREALEAMKASAQDAASEASAQADMRFHRIIVEAAGNAFLAGACAALENVLMAVRLRTSATEYVRLEAIYWHTRILRALEAGDADAAAAEMTGHMDQTRRAAEGLELQ